ncbi:MAG: hypothetical protein U0528_03310 [Anaerolineae bacterium]
MPASQDLFRRGSQSSSRLSACTPSYEIARSSLTTVKPTLPGFFPTVQMDHVGRRLLVRLGGTASASLRSSRTFRRVLVEVGMECQFRVDYAYQN